MLEGYVLSKESLNTIRAIVKEYKDKVQRPSTSSEGGIEDQEFPAPDVYVALTPADGIPALTTESGVGTEDEPGYADCEVYRLVTSPDGLKVMAPVYNLTKRVYNLASTAYDGDNWVLVIRDKLGIWWAISPIAGGGGGELTVMEADGSPSYSNITEFQVDQDEGLTVTQPSPGKVKLTFSSPGLTSSFTGTVVTAVSCSGSTLTVTTKTLTIIVVDGRITSLSLA